MDARFHRHWEKWRAFTAEGKTPADFLAGCSDETLVELLADREGGSDVERNVIATELTNRISRLHRAVEGHSDNVRGLLDENDRNRLKAEAAARAASERTHEAEESMSRTGEADRGIRDATDRLEDETEKTSRYSKRRTREGGW